MKRPVMILVVAWLLASVVGTETAAQSQEQDAAPPPARVWIERGDHLTIKFWPNRSWFDNFVKGQISLAASDEGSSEELSGVAIRLVRFESGVTEAGSRIELLPDFSLGELNRRLKKDLRKIDERSTRTDARGSFNFKDLEPGLYSLQIDWDAVPKEHQLLVWKMEYPSQLPTLNALLVPTAESSPINPQ